MKDLTRKIKSKYILQNISKFVSFTRIIKIIKYNKNLIHKLEQSVENIKNFLFFNKIIKPISNCEDYLPIIKRILSSKVPINTITNLFCDYLNNINNEFIPQINKIRGNEILLDKLNFFKIGFNSQFLDYFSGPENNLLKLKEFCKKYGKKIKEITFMDNESNEIKTYSNSYPIFKYIILNSKVQKIEDRYFNSNYRYNKSTFMNIYKTDLEEHEKDMNDIFKQLKSYSFYYYQTNKNSNIRILSPLCQYILNNGNNLEILELSGIEKLNSLIFIKSLKKLTKLKSLIISSISKDEFFFNSIAKEIKKDSLTKLEINLNNFKEGFEIINNNKNSLLELTIKIKKNGSFNNNIMETLSNIKNLKKLKLVANFGIFDNDNFKYLFLENLNYLEIPFYINDNLFEIKIFFETLPKLKKLVFNGIYLKDNKYLDESKLNYNSINNLKEVNFKNVEKYSSFFIIKFLKILLYAQAKFKTKAIKIENCNFNDQINFNDLFQLISLFPNIKSLSLINISFEKSIPINYNEIKGFEKLEKLYLKGLDYEKNDIKILYFLYKFSERSKYLNELGLSCKGLNPYDINLLFKVAKNYKLLTKLSIFDNYSKNDYFTNEEDGFSKDGINIEEAINYCLLDLRNIDLKIENNFDPNSSPYKDYKKNNINKFFNKNNNQICNKKESYFIYQNLINDNSIKKLFYSKKEKSFIINNINSTNLKNKISS